jgi:hypothetical protein
VSQDIVSRTSRTLLVLGAAVAGLAFLVAGERVAAGALVGALVALVNFQALGWIVRRLVRGETRGRATPSILLVLKMGVLIAVAWALVVRFGVDSLGLMIGLGTLVGAILLVGFAGAERATAGGES